MISCEGSAPEDQNWEKLLKAPMLKPVGRAMLRRRQNNKTGSSFGILTEAIDMEVDLTRQ